MRGRGVKRKSRDSRDKTPTAVSLQSQIDDHREISKTGETIVERKKCKKNRPFEKLPKAPEEFRRADVQRPHSSLGRSAAAVAPVICLAILETDQRIERFKEIAPPRKGIDEKQSENRSHEESKTSVEINSEPIEPRLLPVHGFEDGPVEPYGRGVQPNDDQNYCKDNPRQKSVPFPYRNLRAGKIVTALQILSSIRRIRFSLLLNRTPMNPRQ